MKRKYLIVLIIIVLLSILLLCYYIFSCINNLKPSAQLLKDSDVIKNFILENEKKDNNLKTFIAIEEIYTIINKENVEFYALVLIDTYNVENQLLEHNQSNSKLYKIILKKGKIISSDNIDVEDIRYYNNYSIFPKDIITKYQKIKNSVDLEKSIKKQIDDFYNETK